MKNSCASVPRWSVLAMLTLVTGLNTNGLTIRVPDDASTIQEAIDIAMPDDHIVVGPGTWFESIDFHGKSITLRSEAGAAETILDGSTQQASIVTLTSGETLATRIEGFTFRNGIGTFATACNLKGLLGGAIFAMDSGITIVDSVFELMGTGTVVESDWSITGGGAIFACEADIDITNSRFENNRAGFGGALFFGALDRTARITDTEFTGNTSAHGAGIRFVNDLQATAAVINSTFDRNESAHGGGISAVLRDRGTLTVRNSTFTDGSAAFGGGANITADDRAVVELDRVTFTGNEAGFGGGLYTTAFGDAPVWPGGQIHVSNSYFLGNIAHRCCDVGGYYGPCFEDGGEGSDEYYGGGVDARTLRGGFISFTNTLFARNTGRRAGGALASSCDGGTIQFSNCTVVQNEPSGIHRRLSRREKGAESPGSIEITSSIVRGNGSQSPLEILAENLTATVRFSNVEGGAEGMGNVDVAPSFVDADTCDYRLDARSAGIDAGDNESYPDGLFVDLGGQVRFVDDPEVVDSGSGDGPVIDMGAYERQTDSVDGIEAPCPPRWSERSEPISGEETSGVPRRRATSRPE